MRELRAIGIVLVIGLAVVAVVATLAGGWAMGPGMMWYWGQNAGPGAGNWVWGLGMALGALGMLVFWGAVIVGLVLLVRAAFGGTAVTGRQEHVQETALEILQRRYAAGEIDQPTYERMKEDLAA